MVHLSAADESCLRGLVGEATFIRGCAYVRQGVVTEAVWSANGERVAGAVKGSRVAPYAALVNLIRSPSGQLVDIDSHCSCPMQMDCKHVVALLMTDPQTVLRSIPGPGWQHDKSAGLIRSTAAPGRAKYPPSPPRPAWEEALSELVGPMRPAPNPIASEWGSGTNPEESGSQVGLQFELVIPNLGPGLSGPASWLAQDSGAPMPRVKLRPVLRGAAGGWIKSGISWNNLDYATYSRHQRIDAPEQISLLREILAVSRSTSRFSSYGYRDEPVYLDSMTRRLWDLLAEARALGLVLIGSTKSALPVDARQAKGVVQADITQADITAQRAKEPTGSDEGEVESGSRSSITNGDLVLMPAIEVDGERLPLGRCTLLGTPTHGVLWWDPAGSPTAKQHEWVIRLAPLGRDVDRATARMLAAGQVTVPARDVGRFFDSFYPTLVSRVLLTSSDKSVDLPEAAAPRLTLNIEPVEVAVPVSDPDSGGRSKRSPGKPALRASKSKSRIASAPSTAAQPGVRASWSWVTRVGSSSRVEGLWARDRLTRYQPDQARVIDQIMGKVKMSVGLTEQTGSGRRLLPVTDLVDMAAVEFMVHVVPDLREIEDLDIEISADVPSYRQAMGAPLVSIGSGEGVAAAAPTEQKRREETPPALGPSATGVGPSAAEAIHEPVFLSGTELAEESGEPAGDGPGSTDRDWFDLSVTVSVDGESVPFQMLFEALATGRSQLVLPSGTYFSLDSPDLRRLAELIVEARTWDEQAGDSVRVSRWQAGWWEELARLGVVTGQAVDWEASIRALTQASDRVEHPAPQDFTAEMRPYQLAGFNWLVYLAEHRLGGILADDMGLGKTLQVLAAICHVRQTGPATDPYLVVAPTSVVQNWAAECHKFAPKLRVETVNETLSRRGEDLGDIAARSDLVVTSYTLFRLEFPAYSNIAWSGLVLDEAQFAKNHNSQAFRNAKLLAAPTKLAVTGTPLENNLMELWALLSITAPGLWPDPARFTEHYRMPIERHGSTEQLAKLRDRVRPLMLRRTKDQVAADLPDKMEQVIELTLNPRHQKVYQTYLQRERQKVLGLISDMNRNRFEILRSLTLLRQVSLDAGLVDEKHSKVPSTKLEMLSEMLDDIVADGHRVLVFSQFTRFLTKARDLVRDAGIDYCYLDGRTRKRAEVIERFRGGEVPVFLISLKAGGFGLNLTEADYCILLDPWWNPAAEAQAVDRVHRIGQTRKVMVYRLVSAGTIEEKVMALKAKKSALFANVLDTGDFEMGAMTAEDIRSLLG